MVDDTEGCSDADAEAGAEREGLKPLLSRLFVVICTTAGADAGASTLAAPSRQCVSIPPPFPSTAALPLPSTDFPFPLTASRFSGTGIGIGNGVNSCAVVEGERGSAERRKRVFPLHPPSPMLFPMLLPILTPMLVPREEAGEPWA